MSLLIRYQSIIVTTGTHTRDTHYMAAELISLTIVYTGALVTFCLSRIFMAWKLLDALCWTSMTRPNDPVPSVRIRSNSSRAALFCKQSSAIHRHNVFIAHLCTAWHWNCNVSVRQSAWYCVKSYKKLCRCKATRFVSRNYKSDLQANSRSLVFVPYSISHIWFPVSLPL